jgi:peptidoglycan/xylan/chitin deacetylase (PgdA/CDA1 family)
MRRTFFHRVLRAGAPSVFCPFYHAVRADVPPHLKHLYTPRHPEVFARDVTTYKQYFDPIDPADFMAGKVMGRHQVLITFDDGLRSAAESAWPILKRHGIRPILFVNPDFIDRPSLMYRFKASILVDAIQKRGRPAHPFFEEGQKSASSLLTLSYGERRILDELAEQLGVDWAHYREKYNPYLSVSELQTLVSEGVVVGAHSMSHPYYQEIDLEEQVRQTQASLDWVQENLNVDYRIFSFPFTDEGVEAALLDRVSVDASFGTQKIKQEPWPRHHQRVCMEQAGAAGKNILWAEHVAFQIKRWLGRHRAKHPSK